MDETRWGGGGANKNNDDKARVNRYYIITFWSLHFDGPFKNYSNEISRYLTISLFFSKKKHFDRALSESVTGDHILKREQDQFIVFKVIQLGRYKTR